MRLEDLQWQTEERERRQKKHKLLSRQTSRPRSTMTRPFIERVHIMMERKQRDDEARRLYEQQRRLDEEERMRKPSLKRSEEEILDHVSRLMRLHQASRARLEGQRAAKLKVYILVYIHTLLILPA